MRDILPRRAIASRKLTAYFNARQKRQHHKRSTHLGGWPFPPSNWLYGWTEPTARTALRACAMEQTCAVAGCETSLRSPAYGSYSKLRLARIAFQRHFACTKPERLPTPTPFRALRTHRNTLCAGSGTATLTDADKHTPHAHTTPTSCYLRHACSPPSGFWRVPYARWTATKHTLGAPPAARAFAPCATATPSPPAACHCTGLLPLLQLLAFYPRSATPVPHACHLVLYLCLCSLAAARSTTYRFSSAMQAGWMLDAACLPSSYACFCVGRTRHIALAHDEPPTYLYHHTSISALHAAEQATNDSPPDFLRQNRAPSYNLAYAHTFGSIMISGDTTAAFSGWTARKSPRYVGASGHSACCLR